MSTHTPWRRHARAALEELRRAVESSGLAVGEVAVALADPPSPMLWLEAAPPGAARALFGPDDLGLGQAWRLDGASLDTLAVAAPFSRRWISMPFDTSTPPHRPWASFGRVRCWTPRVEWSRGQGVVARWTQGLRGRGATLRLLDALSMELERPSLSRGNQPSFPESRPAHMTAAWARAVDQAVQAMESSTSALVKVVLARCIHMPLGRALAPLALLDALRQAEPGCWPYFLSWTGAPCLFGASPELLFSRRGRQVRTMALAGTRARGGTPPEDRALGRALLASAKDGHEQGLVAHWLRLMLEALCEGDVRVGPRRLRRLARVQHLESRVEGRLRAGVGDVQVLEALHPTPALCGSPRGDAGGWIRAHEAAARGLYGGVLGVLEPHRSHVQVAIRGALAHGGSLHLWAGAGLVPGSEAAAEWQETSIKLDSLLKVWRHS